MRVGGIQLTGQGLCDSFANFACIKPNTSQIQKAGVAQSVEQGTENPRVGGSIPSPGTIFQFHLKILLKPPFYFQL